MRRAADQPPILPSQRGVATFAVALAAAVIVPVLLPHDGRVAVAAGANLLIFSAYLFVATALAPWFRAKYITTRAAGALFFLTCGLTHLHHFFDAVTQTHNDYGSVFHAVNHTTQAVAVAAFLGGLWWEFLRGESVWPPRLDFSRMFGRNKSDEQPAA